MAAVKSLLCLLCLAASNLSCVALVSFFLTTLPTNRNLFTFFDTTLVLALTSVVDIAVRITLFLAAPKNAIASSQFLPKLFCFCHRFSSVTCSCFQRLTFHSQCTAVLCFQAFGHPPPLLVAALKFSLMWSAGLVRCSFISLSVTRMFLLFRVSTQ